MENLTNEEIDNLMKKERISLTCAPGGENNRGMEIIGRMPVKGEGFTAVDIEGLSSYFKEIYLKDKVDLLNLNELSGELNFKDFEDENQARVLILRDWATKFDRDIYKEIAPIRWDAEYLDPNKYRTEIVDGKEIKVRGKRMNKRARTNLCFVADREQEPAVYEGKGTIYDLKKLSTLNKAVSELRDQIKAGLIHIDSKTKVEINVVEGNRYYNLKNTGIGFHGDTERVVVICISIGGYSYPMRWQWFHDGMPIGKTIEITLNSGDVYIMSEKAVGSDWKKKSLFTLRHAAGANKYISLSKWEKKRSAYELKIKEKVKKVKKNDKINKGKTTKNGNLKEVLKKKNVDPRKLYLKALKKHDWEDSRKGFYKWLEIESTHECSPNHVELKELNLIWTGKAENFSQKMDIEQWEKHRAFYKNLCAYGVYF